MQKRTEEQFKGPAEGCGLFVDGNEGKEPLLVLSTISVPRTVGARATRYIANST